MSGICIPQIKKLFLSKKKTNEKRADLKSIFIQESESTTHHSTHQVNIVLCSLFIKQSLTKIKNHRFERFFNTFAS